jgi:alkaline phosphatase D
MTAHGSPRTSRRNFLRLAGGTGGILLAGATASPALAQTANGAGSVSAFPFTLGVASGDPAPDGAVLWTRLAPEPLSPDGGVSGAIPVQWQVATDPQMRRVIRAGSEVADASWGHSVHVEVEGLAALSDYWYRFRVGQHISPVGHLRTLPSAGATASALAMAVVSCQNFTNGRYAAYRHLAEQDMDFVLHLGDYIYESAGPGNPAPGADRKHIPFKTIRTLDEYRLRYSQYKLDPQLQAAHSAHSFICVPDDHEVVNNFAGDFGADGNSTPEVFLPRRAAAFQAMYENLPLRRTSMPQGPDMQLYRRLEFGDLARLSILDTRQYRSPQQDGPTFAPLGEAALDEDRTLTGPEQERWLFDGLRQSPARWNVIAQQIYMAAIDMDSTEGQSFNTDKWDGYPAARSRLTQFLAAEKPRNPIVLAGDVHATMVNDVTLTADPASPVVATEFAGTSISSGKANSDIFEAALPHNPQVRYFNGRERGYISCQVVRDTWRTDLWFVDDVNKADSPVGLRTSFVVNDGVPGAKEA